MNPPGETLLVAGLSARLLAEGAARDGYGVIACDVFGDADTRRAARRWQAIGDARRRIDPALLLAALDDAAREPGVAGWVAGSDLEGLPALLEAGERRLPRLGTPAHAVRRVRDMRDFFAALARLGLAHPDTRFEPPADPRGWLCKDAGGAGGWHIRAAGDPKAAATARAPYWQRELPGQPMSALFLAADDGVQCLGVHELIVRPLGAHPHVYRGAIGPVALPPALAAALRRALELLSAEFGLRGLASLDVLRSGDTLLLLEINPRPSASMALHARLPLMRAHVAACRGEPVPALASPASPVRGSEIVFARRGFRLSEAQAAWLAARGDCHDLPLAGGVFDSGDPLCSLEAEGADADIVRARLTAERSTLRDAMAQT